jgi:hypothetical protein
VEVAGRASPGGVCPIEETAPSALVPIALGFVVGLVIILAAFFQDPLIAAAGRLVALGARLAAPIVALASLAGRRALDALGAALAGATATRPRPASALPAAGPTWRTAGPADDERGAEGVAPPRPLRLSLWEKVRAGASRMGEALGSVAIRDGAGRAWRGHGGEPDRRRAAASDWQDELRSRPLAADQPDEEPDVEPRAPDRSLDPDAAAEPPWSEPPAIAPLPVPDDAPSRRPLLRPRSYRPASSVHVEEAARRFLRERGGSATVDVVVRRLDREFGEGLGVGMLEGLRKRGVVDLRRDPDRPTHILAILTDTDSEAVGG